MQYINEFNKHTYPLEVLCAWNPVRCTVQNNKLYEFKNVNRYNKLYGVNIWNALVFNEIGTGVWVDFAMLSEQEQQIVIDTDNGVVK